MARKKISELPLDTAVIGTDVVPIVSDGATKRVQLATLGTYFSTVPSVPSSHAASHGQAGGDPITIVSAQVSDFNSAVVAASPPATWETLTGKPSTFTPSAHVHAISDVTGLQTALDAKATPADVTTAVNAVIDAAPSALNTLNELAAALGNDASFATTVTNALAAKAPLASPTFTGTVSGITATMVGLGNVDNTSDANKPISTATQTALDGKAASSHTHTASAITDFTAAVVAAAPAYTLPAATTTTLGGVIVGSGLAVSSGTVSVVTFDVRSDTVGSTSYIGRAVAGSATSASVWTIRRTVLTSAGAVSSTTTATNVKWDDRLTASYS